MATAGRENDEKSREMHGDRPRLYLETGMQMPLGDNTNYSEPAQRFDSEVSPDHQFNSFNSIVT